jgi:hypothetical protein
VYLSCLILLCLVLSRQVVKIKMAFLVMHLDGSLKSALKGRRLVFLVFVFFSCICCLVNIFLYLVLPHVQEWTKTRARKKREEKDERRQERSPFLPLIFWLAKQIGPDLILFVFSYLAFPCLFPCLFLLLCLVLSCLVLSCHCLYDCRCLVIFSVIVLHCLML